MARFVTDFALKLFSRTLEFFCMQCVTTSDTFPSFIVLVTKSSSFIKNQNMSLWRILAVSGGYYAKLTCAWTALYHLSTFLFPWHKLVSRSKWALTSFDQGFKNSSNLTHIMSNVSSSLGRLQETYRSILKSPDQAITFWYFCFSGRFASSQYKMVSHFKCHLRNLWYSPLSTVQFILGPSI